MLGEKKGTWVCFKLAGELDSGSLSGPLETGLRDELRPVQAGGSEGGRHGENNGGSCESFGGGPGGLRFCCGG